MSFKIVFEEDSIGELSPSQIENFSFVSSIFKLYSGCKFIIKDFSKSLNNRLKTGMKVGVSFFVDEGEESFNEMAVLSFSKTGSNKFIEYVDITLISAIFFENTINTLTRTGNVGQIVKDILSKEFKLEEKQLVLEDTDDRVRRRYQLAEKSQDFMKNLMKYGTYLNTSVYLYTSPDGKIYLKSSYSMVTEQPKTAFTTSLADKLIEKPEGSDTVVGLVMSSFNINATGKNAVATMDNVFCTDNFKFSSDFDSHWETYSPEKDNSQSAIHSPTKTRFFNWNLTPDDAKAIAIRDFFEETSDTYSLLCTFDGWSLKEVNLGSPVYLILPYEPTVKSSTGADINLGEGIYLITQVKLLFNNRSETMAVSLSQISS